MTEYKTNAELAQSYLDVYGTGGYGGTRGRIAELVRGSKENIPEYYGVWKTLKGLDIKGIGVKTREDLERLFSRGPDDAKRSVQESQKEKALAPRAHRPSHRSSSDYYDGSWDNTVRRLED